MLEGSERESGRAAERSLIIECTIAIEPSADLDSPKTPYQAHKKTNMKEQRIITLLAAVFFTQAGMAQSTGTFTDSRDGQTYKTFSFKNASTGTTVTWMAQNLNHKVEGSYAYDDKESHRKELGLLYTWEAAKKACPKGWHLATDSEWSMLVTNFGGMDKAGDALKSVSGWIEGGNGNNSSGFDGLPGGIGRDGGYAVRGAMGFWWSSTPSEVEGKAWGWNFSYGGPGKKPLKTKAFRFDSSVSHAKSVRCVRD